MGKKEKKNKTKGQKMFICLSNPQAKTKKGSWCPACETHQSLDFLCNSQRISLKIPQVQKDEQESYDLVSCM